MRLETLRQEATNAYDRGDREAALSAASAVVQLVPDNDYRRARAGLDAAAPLAQTAPPERVDTAAANAPAAITRALARYQAAYQGVDAAALESVYPNVPPRAMLDAMESFSMYEVELIRQPPVISGDTATVETQLSFSARRKAGGTAQADGPATFEFRREGADWLIAQIDMSGVG